MKIDFQQLINSLPKSQSIPQSLENIREYNRQQRTKIVVLDDDPTGCQTVHDVPLLLKWDSSLLQEVLNQNDCFYVLTNSRAYPEKEAVKINLQVLENLSSIAQNFNLCVISRSDSTLRGHFPAETDIISAKLGPFNGLVIIPFFLEGGRLTINDTHYVRVGDGLIPAHLTEFAKDPVFGFSTSFLPKWIEEKSTGKWKARETRSITLTDIRGGGVEQVYQQLRKISGYQPVIVNAITYEDLEIFVLGLCKAEAEGKKFLYRTAASFVKVRAAISNQDFIKPEMVGKKGLIIVGSFVTKSTEQCHYLIKNSNINQVAVIIKKVLTDHDSNYLNLVSSKINQYLTKDEPVIIYTEREYVLGGTTKERLEAGKKISDFLSTIIQNINIQPDFVIAKGGITAHDIAKKGFGATRAMVMGQIIPGVPVWQLGKDCKFPGMPYVVFPGNVGDESALFTVFSKFYG